jgi:ketosteroid isomerase-like protein
MDGGHSASGEDEPARENLRAVRVHYAAFAAGDIDRLIEGLDDDISIRIHDEHGVKIGPPMTGKTAARAFFERIHSSVDDASVEIEDLRADGDRVLARLTLGGTLRGGGRSGTIEAVHLFTVCDGLIAEIRTHRPRWDEEEPGS